LRPHPLPSPSSALTFLCPHPPLPSPPSAHTFLCPHLPLPSPSSALTFLCPHPPLPSPSSAHTFLCPHLPLPTPSSAHTFLCPHLPLPTPSSAHAPSPCVRYRPQHSRHKERSQAQVTSAGHKRRGLRGGWHTGELAQPSLAAMRATSRRRVCFRPPARPLISWSR
jgi:hypothetical protein